MRMYLEQFLNDNSDWQAKLAVEPYCLEVRQDGDYFLFKYNMILSDFFNPIVLEARGSIFRKINGVWTCVCRALDKFGNYGESYAPTLSMDWELGVDVQEKIDGSIMKLWYDQEYWHLSTNGTINAFKAECGDTTFGDIFMSLVQENSDWDKFLDTLSTDYTYWFELVHPQYNRIVIQYTEPAIYLLGMRHNRTHEEIINYKSNSVVKLNSWLKQPRHFTYHSLAECIDAAHKMGVNEEGYVCISQHMVNGSYLRIKVKGDEYLRLHKMRGNGALTTLRVIEMWQADSLDDFMAYYPEYNNFVAKIVNVIKNLIDVSDIAYKTISGHSDIQSRADFAHYANSYIYPLRAFLFARLDNKVKDACDFYKNMRARNLATHIQGITQETSVGAVEDE